jgi:hypothetical protein
VPIRRAVPLICLTALVATGIALPTAAAAAASPPSRLTAQHRLSPGQQLQSADGAYRASVGASGRLVVRTRAGSVRWSSPAAGRGAYAYLGSAGNLSLRTGTTIRWQSDTAGAGRSTVLTLRDDGVLALTAGPLLVWSTRQPNACPRTRGATFDVDISEQLARMCDDGHQLRETPVTTGASAHGDATPTGTWHVYAKQRNTTLYPSGGGAYPVRYWVPYNGAYGVHDSSWQNFAYGSSLYRTRGSHGCTHVPLTAMTWFFGWVRVGTTVHVHH